MSWTSNARPEEFAERFEETGAWAEGHWFAVEGEAFSGRTRFQDVQILDTTEYGRMLVLDGHVQSVEDDEGIYHESLVQPAMLLHPEPKRVLIIGGGEGATAREVLRHPSVQQVTMVDLDGELVELCREHLPQWHAGAFDDPRVQLVVGDGLRFIAEDAGGWDVIILDLVDAYEQGPSEALFATAFFSNVRAKLAPGGVVGVQAMEFSATCPDDHLIVRRNFAPVFKHFLSYTTFVPSFWCEWGYLLGSDIHDPAALTAAEVDARIAARDLPLTYLDGTTWQRMRSLCRPLRQLIAGGVA
jgi:spermidine synthase